MGTCGPIEEDSNFERARSCTGVFDPESRVCSPSGHRDKLPTKTQTIDFNYPPF